MSVTSCVRVFTLPALLLLALSSCQKTVSRANHVPVVFADTSRSVTLPVDSVILYGSASDTGGKVVAWLWSEVSGPNVPVIHTEGSPATVITGLVPGIYEFQLMVLDSAGETGVGKVSVTVYPAIVKGPGILTLYSDTVNAGFYEMHYQGNNVNDMSDRTAVELSAFTWTVNGEIFYGRDAFKFDMHTLPQGLAVKSAKLSLYSNHSPINGDHINANSGAANAFYINRIVNFWTPATATWANQPGIDTTGRVLIPQTDEPFLDLVDVDVTAMVNKMISDGNFGFKIQLQSEVIYNVRVFYSSRVTDPAKRPKLIVSY